MGSQPLPPFERLRRLKLAEAEQREQDRIATQMASHGTSVASPNHSRQEALAQPEVAAEGASGGYQEPPPVATSLFPVAASHVDGIAPAVASHGHKPKPNRSVRFTQLNVRITKELKAKIDILAGVEGKGIAEVVEEALRLWLATGSANKLAAFDADNDLTDDIIKLYARLTGRMMTAADREAYASVKGFAVNAIKIGMYTTIFNSKGNPINSFKYFLPEIQKAALAIGTIGSPDEYVAYLRAKVKKEFGRG